MPFRIALIIAITFQVISVAMALRLHWKYRSHSAWIMMSGAAMLVAFLEIAMLLLIWNITGEVQSSLYIWAVCLSAILVSVLFTGGFALIEPLFVELAEAEKLLRTEKQQLERTVQVTEDELRLARQIQQNLLPKSSPNLAGFDIAGASRPADWTSGDYFDFIETPSGLLVVVADVSGHGTGPALLMVETRAFLRGLSEDGRDVGAILTQTNRVIAADTEANQFVTAFAVKLLADGKQFSYSAAGHDALLISSDGSRREFGANKPPLGIDEDIEFQSSESLAFQKGEILLLMTDGIAEAKSGAGEQFGVDRAVAVIESNRSLPAEKIVARLFDEVSKFAGGNSLDDDITAVVVKSV